MNWRKIRHTIEDGFLGAVGLALAIGIGWLLWIWFVLARCNCKGVIYAFVG